MRLRPLCCIERVSFCKSSGANLVKPVAVGTDSATEPVTLAVIGAGLRGAGYARLAARTGRARIVAVAEPDPVRRAAFAAEHGLDDALVFERWEDLVERSQLADAVIIATQDRFHAEPAIAAAGLGYHVLLEKPMAPTEAEATAIADAADRAGIVLMVCHVLRYTPYTRALRRVLDEGRIGRVTTIQHLEPVGWWHQAHAYVRGNWSNEARSAPMLLAKACHDLDWIVHVKGMLPTKVSSFGSLTHFHPAQAPEGAAERCLDCQVENQCLYSAKRFYLETCLPDPKLRAWPLAAVTDEMTRDGVTRALREGPYGRCVYACDNDVVDNQVVNLEFPDGATASFTMTAFSAAAHRMTRIFGTRGVIEGDGRTLRLREFGKATAASKDGGGAGAEEIIDTGAAGGPTAADGHGGGDIGVVEAFLAEVQAAVAGAVSGSGGGESKHVLTDAATSLATHRIVWAAERSRRLGTVEELRKSPGG